MKYVLLIAVTLLSTMTYGDRFIKEGLTEEQVLKLEQTAIQMKIDETRNPQDTAKDVTEWVSIGEKLGKGLVSCAKEMGVEVNSFVQTPVGKIAAYIIIWKLVGRDIVHYGFGSVFLAVGLILWIHFFRRLCVYDNVSYGEKLGKLGLRHKIIQYRGEGEVDGTRVLMLFVLIGLIITSISIIFS